MKSSIYNLIVISIIIILLAIVFFSFRFLYLAQKKASTPSQEAAESMMTKFDMGKYNEIKSMFVELE